MCVYRQLVIFFSLIGIGLSLYAFYIETRKSTDPTYRAACDLSESMSCSRVLTSRWARGFGLFGSDSIFNLPTSIFALIYYCLSLLFNLSYQSKGIARLRVLFSVLTNCGSVYLGYVLYFILKDFCFICFGMYIVNFMLLISNWRLLNQTRKINNRKQKKQ